jgi:hypothetical protein
MPIGRPFVGWIAGAVRIVQDARPNPYHLLPGRWNKVRIPRVARSLPEFGSGSVKSMRAKTKTSTVLLTSAVKLMGHATMGLAIGLAFAFFVTRFDPLGIMGLVRGDMEPGMTPSILVGIIVLSFTVGTTLTGFAFMMMEDR